MLKAQGRRLTNAETLTYHGRIYTLLREVIGADGAAMADTQRLIRCPVCLNEATASSGFGKRVSCRACGGSFALDNALPALKKDAFGKSEMIDFSMIESSARGYLSWVYLGVSLALLISAVTVHAGRVVPFVHDLVCADWHLIIFAAPVVLAVVLGNQVRTMHPIFRPHWAGALRRCPWPGPRRN